MIITKELDVAELYEELASKKASSHYLNAIQLADAAGSVISPNDYKTCADLESMRGMILKRFADQRVSRMKLDEESLLLHLAVDAYKRAYYNMIALCDMVNSNE